MENIFKKRQKDLLWMANTEAGKYLLGLKDKEKIVKLSPNSIHILKDKKEKIIQATFYTDNRVAEVLIPNLEKIDISESNYSKSIDKYEELLHFSGLQLSNNLPQIFLNTKTFNPATGEGRVYSSSAVWATARAGGGTLTVNASPSIYCDTAYQIDRPFFPFNTSSLSRRAVILGGSNTIKVYREDSNGGFNNPNTTRFDLLQSTQADPTSLAAADFTRVTFTSGGNLSFASTTNHVYSTITFNSTADGWINKTGYTKLAMCSGRDFDNSAPTDYNWLCFSTRGSANPTVLTVNYKIVGDWFFFF